MMTLSKRTNNYKLNCFSLLLGYESVIVHCLMTIRLELDVEPSFLPLIYKTWLDTSFETGDV